MSTYSTVIFDADGTLIDTIDLIVSSYQHAHREVLGQELARETILPTIGRTLWEVYGELAPDRVDDLVAAYFAHNHQHLHTVLAYDKVPELLRDLRAAGLALAVATSKRRRSLTPTLTACGLIDAFDAITTADDTSAHKPDPEPLLHTLRRLGAAAADAVYVGDAATDIQAAQAAGVASIGVTYGAGSHEEIAAAGPDRICASVEELRDVLLG